MANIPNNYVAVFTSILNASERICVLRFMSSKRLYTASLREYRVALGIVPVSGYIFQRSEIVASN